MARRVDIVPHTHWDREWYSPFQTFRLRLVDLLDDLLPRLDADPAYGHFMLDGQMAVIDDYLAVRPEAETTLRRLAGAGRLSVGPWYILMDEFLVSGETTVRNLQLGLDRAAAFGGAMNVGQSPAHVRDRVLHPVVIEVDHASTVLVGEQDARAPVQGPDVEPGLAVLGLLLEEIAKETALWFEEHAVARRRRVDQQHGLGVRAEAALLVEPEAAHARELAPGRRRLPEEPIRLRVFLVGLRATASRHW
jgi:hypothetical protein